MGYNSKPLLVFTGHLNGRSASGWVRSYITVQYPARCGGGLRLKSFTIRFQYVKVRHIYKTALQ